MDAAVKRLRAGVNTACAVLAGPIHMRILSSRPGKVCIWLTWAAVTLYIPNFGLSQALYPAWVEAQRECILFETGNALG